MKKAWCIIRAKTGTLSLSLWLHCLVWTQPRSDIRSRDLFLFQASVGEMRRRCYAASHLVLKSAAKWRIASFTVAARNRKISAAAAGSQISEDFTGHMFLSNMETKPQHQRGEKKQLKQEVSSEDTDGNWLEWRGLRVIVLAVERATQLIRWGLWTAGFITRLVEQ